MEFALFLIPLANMTSSFERKEFGALSGRTAVH